MKRELKIDESGLVRSPLKSRSLGALDVTKPYNFIWLRDIHGPKSNEFTRGFRDDYLAHKHQYLKGSFDAGVCGL